MATVNYTAGACPALLVAQSDIMQNNDPNALIERVGFLQALKDPSNVATATITDVGAGNGGTRIMRVHGRKPTIASDATDARDCDPGTATTRTETLAEADMHTQMAVQVTEAEIRQLCEGYSQWQQVPQAQRANNGQASEGMAMMRETYDVVSSAFHGMRGGINSNLLTAAALAPGTFADGATSKSFEFLKADHSPNLKGFNEMMQAIRRSTFTGQPIIVGEGNIELALMSLGYGCCNDGGTDFGKMAQNPGFKFYADLGIDAALGVGTNEALVFMPGTMQLLAYNAYVGNFATNIGSTARGTIADPAIPGLRYDLRIVPDECDEIYNVYLNLNYGLWSADDLFKVGDRRAGVNGIFKIAGTIGA